MLTMKIKDAFFDRSAVLAQIGARRVKVLSKAGAFVRTRARTSMRKRKGTSPPGQPPYAHEGSLRRLVLFGYDRSSDSVIVGPVGFNKSVAPAALEFGGESTRSFFSKRQGRVMKKTVQIRPRPYMGPALDREAARFPGLFKDALLKN